MTRLASRMHEPIPVLEASVKWRYDRLSTAEKGSWDMTKNGLACFLMGLGTGIGLALLFAPERGDQIRARIKVKRDEGVESLKKGGAALKEMATDVVGKGQEVVNRAKDALAETVAEGKKDIDEARGA